MTEIIASIGHNLGPDLDCKPASTRTQWAKALFADPDTPVYVMAMSWAIHWYSRSDGSGAALSNAQFEAMCGISVDTAIRGKRWLLAHGYVSITAGTGATKSQFKMTLPVCATELDRGRTQRPLEGSHTATPMPGGVAHSDPEGSHTATPGVAHSDPVFNKENPDTIQEKNARARGRSESGRSIWTNALNPDNPDYQFENGQLTLLNGSRSKWLLEFGDDAKRLDLALIQVAGQIQPHGSKPISIQVNAGLARIAAEKLDRDSRYASAAKARPSGGSDYIDAKTKAAMEWGKIRRQLAGEKE